MPSYLVEVKKHFDIAAQRRARSVFAGNHGSVFKGRSMDFDELREYNYGDDVKDIDWNSTARSRQVMIRKYIAIRKHNILVLGDTGREMSTLAPSGETKADVAAYCAGVVSYIALNEQDLIGILFGDSQYSSRYGLKENRAHAEHFLNAYHNAVKRKSPRGDFNALLGFCAKSYREPAFVFAICDTTSAANLDYAILHKVTARHDVIFIIIEDMPLTSTKTKKRELCDLEDGVKLPLFIRHNKKLAKAEENFREQQKKDIVAKLRQARVMNCFVDSKANAIPQILTVLEEQKRAHRK